MGCADTCVVMNYDGYSEFTRETFPRARKPYRCDECLGEIPVGAVHQSLVGKSDGDLWTARTCAPCAEIRKAFVCDSWEVAALWEEIAEQLFREWNDMLAIDCLAKLSTQPAIDKMREKYAEYREDSDDGR